MCIVPENESKRIERMILLRSKSKSDYMTKMDLVDYYPNLFKGKGTVMSQDEIEQLRILVVGDKKLFMSRKPSKRVLESAGFQRIQQRMMPGYARLVKEKMRRELENRAGASIPNRRDGMLLSKASNIDITAKAALLAMGNN